MMRCPDGPVTGSMRVIFGRVNRKRLAGTAVYDGSRWTGPLLRREVSCRDVRIILEDVLITLRIARSVSLFIWEMSRLWSLPVRCIDRPSDRLKRQILLKMSLISTI